jgi:glycosyltransferase involved in cell wall biosynthesis
VSRVYAVLTVNDDLANVLEQRYQPRRIIAIHNCPDRWSPPAPRSRAIRDATGIPVDEPVVLYHGSLGANRGIEQLIAALREPGLERAHLVLLGFGENRDRYLEASTEPGLAGRVHVLDPVPPPDLPRWIASADIGAMPIQRSTLNHYLSTPNKLFESLGAGIPVVASDFPAMHRIVIDNPAGPLGAVCDPARVEEIAAEIRSIVELDARAASALRSRCLAAAHDRWNWQLESSGLVRLYEGLAAKPA